VGEVDRAEEAEIEEELKIASEVRFGSGEGRIVRIDERVGV
jgi:hypothetical protein